MPAGGIPAAANVSEVSAAPGAVGRTPGEPPRLSRKARSFESGRETQPVLMAVVSQQ